MGLGDGFGHAPLGNGLGNDFGNGPHGFGNKFGNGPQGIGNGPQTPGKRIGWIWEGPTWVSEQVRETPWMVWGNSLDGFGKTFGKWILIFLGVVEK